MGSRSADIVPYDASRSRSRSRSRRRKSPKYSRSRSRSKSGKGKVVSVRISMAASKVTELKFAKQHSEARVENARMKQQAALKAVEAAQKELEEAIAADHEISGKLQEASRDASRAEEVDRIQKVVDERFEAKRSRDFEKADRLEEELRNMGVQVTGSFLTWRGPGGLTGKVQARRPGDWECTTCDILVVSKSNKCFKCGARKPGTEGQPSPSRSRSRGRGRNQGRGRRSPSYRGRPQRGGDPRDRGGGGRNYRGRGRDSYSPSRSPPPRRR
mmetsp:Transcript_70164/g.124879  ORF Transcript_70164/g.124879 Transcript_70164/m.124879 type:complete len:272 (+) Transcript_70164:96-911(+)